MFHKGGMAPRRGGTFLSETAGAAAFALGLNPVQGLHRRGKAGFGDNPAIGSNLEAWCGFAAAGGQGMKRRPVLRPTGPRLGGT